MVPASSEHEIRNRFSIEPSREPLKIVHVPCEYRVGNPFRGSKGPVNELLQLFASTVVVVSGINRVMNRENEGLAFICSLELSDQPCKLIGVDSATRRNIAVQTNECYKRGCQREIAIR